MKYAFIFLIAISLTLGCGHLAGNDPEGVTGGHAGGYGSFGSTFSGGGDNLILGAWQQDGSQGDHNIVTFNADGTVRVDFYNGDQHYSQNGAYYISGNRLDINVNGWKGGSGIFTITGEVLTVNFDDGVVTLQRAQ